MYCIRYIIKKGDTLYGICRHFFVPVKAVIDANPLVNMYNLIAGVTICIPIIVPGSQYTNFTTYLVNDEDTLGSILENNNINLAELLELNDLNAIYPAPGTTIKIPIIPGKESGVTL